MSCFWAGAGGFVLFFAHFVFLFLLYCITAYMISSSLFSSPSFQQNATSKLAEVLSPLERATADSSTMPVSTLACRVAMRVFLGLCKLLVMILVASCCGRTGGWILTARGSETGQGELRTVRKTIHSIFSRIDLLIDTLIPYLHYVWIYRMIPAVIYMSHDTVSG